ncbi:MAG: 30S ribosomal protein S16 [Saprospiraceae bacterium]|nr:30S ribosomal protein S16 [Saprospiraceae bacterium]
MSVKIRLQRKGRKKRPFYHIVIADARSPRDGRFIEKIGTYNPLTKPATIEIDREKAYEWLMNGAQPTDTVRAILRFKGVYYRKHLMRGVKKGAMSVEEAELKYNEWVDTKEAKIAARFAKTAEEMAEFHARVAGANITVPVAKKEEKPVESELLKTVSDEVEETVEDVVETVEDNVEAAVEESVEEIAAEVNESEVAEAPAAEEEKAEE